jgi:hypothetical protein
MIDALFLISLFAPPVAVVVSAAALAISAVAGALRPAVLRTAH